MIRTNRIVRFALLLLLVFSFCGCAPEPETSEKEKKKTPKTGKKRKKAPDFTLHSVIGDETVTLSDYKGKVVLLDFWATWCGPCKATIPNLNRLYKKYSSQGFEIIGVSVDRIQNMQDEDKVQRFVRQYSMSYPVAFVETLMRAQYGGIPSIPMAFIIDREGMVVTVMQGYSPALEKRMEKTIKELL